jgi:cytochrome c oxidase subunit III
MSHEAAANLSPAEVRDHAHPPALAHHFDNLAQQAEATTLGMWVFLVTEVLFFGGLFATYMVYRTWYPEAFTAASREMVVWAGTTNTAVLITSSLTMALAVRAAQMGQRGLLMALLVVTMALGCVFLGIKTFEYYTEFKEHHVPGFDFQFEKEHFQHAQLFFSLYFVMTGLHALHMIIGLGIMLVMLWWSYRRIITPEYYSPIEISGLYWHFVDIVWIFLFPLLYLIGRHVHV